jgi:hypothetical protein
MLANALHPCKPLQIVALVLRPLAGLELLLFAALDRYGKSAQTK